MTKEVTPQVTLLSYTNNPIRSLYMAYRVCYSQFTPQQIAEQIEYEDITQEQMLDFVVERLKTGHGSPLEQVWFEFGISGVSRAFSHQFVRHRTGISFEQQSQRYVVERSHKFKYVVPKTVKKEGLEGYYRIVMGAIAEAYGNLIVAGIPAEDARFLLPNAASTNFKITVNFQEFLHIADLRLCTRAQWEFRKVVALMRAEVMREVPVLGSYLQPKCGEHRLGYCDESLKDYNKCPLSAVRPHKDSVLNNVNDTQTQPNLTMPIREEDWEIINE